MYTNVWAKYLPIIRIVMKRALTSDQVLPLNVPDFERAGMKRKSGYKFAFGFKDGRVKNVIIDLPLASSLASSLIEDPAVKQLISLHDFDLTLSPRFELTIKHIPKEGELQEVTDGHALEAK